MKNGATLSASIHIKTRVSFRLDIFWSGSQKDLKTRTQVNYKDTQLARQTVG